MFCRNYQSNETPYDCVTWAVCAHTVESFYALTPTSGNAGFEFLMDPVQPAHYSSQAPPRPWDSYRLRVVSTSTGTTLPYINTTMPTTGDSTLVYQTNQPLALPTATLGAGDSRSPEKKVSASSKLHGHISCLEMMFE